MDIYAPCTDCHNIRHYGIDVMWVAIQTCDIMTILKNFAQNTHMPTKTDQI